jgi:hypothetical protein
MPLVPFIAAPWLCRSPKHRAPSRPFRRLHGLILFIAGTLGTFVIAHRAGRAAKQKRFKVQRVLGAADLWVTELNPYIRRLAVLHGEYHGVQRREGCP